MTSNDLTAPREAPVTASSPPPLHRPAGTGATYVGPGDLYRFLVIGDETGGAYFAMEAIVPPGGGPPPHIHRREDETLEPLLDPTAPIPDNVDAVAARFDAAAPRYGMEFLIE